MISYNSIINLNYETLEKILHLPDGVHIIDVVNNDKLPGLISVVLSSNTQTFYNLKIGDKEWFIGKPSANITITKKE